jgi:hypothetical protein
MTQPATVHCAKRSLECHKTINSARRRGSKGVCQDAGDSFAANGSIAVSGSACRGLILSPDMKVERKMVVICCVAASPGAHRHYQEDHQAALRYFACPTEPV